MGCTATEAAAFLNTSQKCAPPADVVCGLNMRATPFTYHPRLIIRKTREVAPGPRKTFYKAATNRIGNLNENRWNRRLPFDSTCHCRSNHQYDVWSCFDQFTCVIGKPVKVAFAPADQQNVVRPFCVSEGVQLLRNAVTYCPCVCTEPGANTPIRRTLPACCWPRAVIGHAIAAPPSNAMNSSLHEPP